MDISPNRSEVNSNRINQIAIYCYLLLYLSLGSIFPEEVFHAQLCFERPL